MGTVVPIGNSNIGEVGRKSIRIGGKRIDDLSMVAAAHLKFQLPIVEDGERQQKVKEVLQKYPKHDPVYLDSRVKECNENIVRITKLKGDQDTMIEEYTGQISMCRHRDSEIAKVKLSSLLEGAQQKKIKELKKNFPLYNVVAMEQQVVQCRQANERCDKVVAQENASIAELREVQILIALRDQELQSLGVSQSAI